MKNNARPNAMPPELVMAIGLIWGHLNAEQYEEAGQLARGALRVWPEDNYLRMMAAFAAVETGRPLDDDLRAALDAAGCEEWKQLVLRRAGLDESGVASC